jgi:ribosomal protein L32
MLYDEEEDNLLKLLLREFGVHWKVIKKHFNARINRDKIYTEHMLRNRYNRISKQKRQSLNVCSKCGQLSRGHTCSRTLNYNTVRLQLKGESELSNTVDLNVIISDVEASLFSKMRPLTCFDEWTQDGYADLSNETPQMFEEYFVDKQPLQTVSQYLAFDSACTV